MESAENLTKSQLCLLFLSIEVMDTIMGGKTAVIPVHLLDLDASRSPVTMESEGEDDTTTETVDQPTISNPAASSQSTTPVPAVTSHPSTLAPAISRHPSTSQNLFSEE